MAPQNEKIEIALDETIKAPALKTQQEEFPWLEKYDNLDYSNDKIPATEIKDKGKGQHTLGSIIYPGLRATNDRNVAMDKLNAICARLVQADFNPNSVKTGYIIRLEDKVLYIERPKAKKGQRLGLQLQRGAEIIGSYERLKPVREIARDEILENSQKRWENLRQVIDRSITYDVIVALYGKKYTNRKLNFEKRKHIWETEMGEAEPFTGNATQNKKILLFIKEKLKQEGKEEKDKEKEDSELETLMTEPTIKEGVQAAEEAEKKEAPTPTFAETLVKNAETATATPKLKLKKPTYKITPLAFDEINILNENYLAEIVDSYKGAQRTIYNALSEADQKNIEEDKQFKGVILIKNGRRYRIKVASAAKHAGKIEIKIQAESGDWVHPDPEIRRTQTPTFDATAPDRRQEPEGAICEIGELQAKLEEFAKKNEKGNEYPERPLPFSYRPAEIWYGKEARVERTEKGILRHVIYEMKMSEEQKKIEIDGKQYVMDPKAVKDVYETGPQLIERYIAFYPVDAVGDMSKVDNIEIRYNRSTQKVISAKIVSNRGQSVTFPQDHPALKFEEVQ